MRKILALSLVASLLGCGDHDHDVSDPTCQRIEAACASARNPAQMSCHDLAHGNNGATCSARLNECLTTCGADASTPAG
jgi:hypothetical protein